MKPNSSLQLRHDERLVSIAGVIINGFYCNMSLEKEIEVSYAVSILRKMVVLTVYRTCLGSLGIFMLEFEKILHVLNGKFGSYTIVICGDFNINLMIDSREKCDFIDVLDSFGFQQTIKEPTRITKTTKTLIDGIFVNCPDYFNNENIDTSLSDHRAQFISIKSRYFILKKKLFRNDCSQIIKFGSFMKVYVIFHGMVFWKRGTQ